MTIFLPGDDDPPPDPTVIRFDQATHQTYDNSPNHKVFVSIPSGGNPNGITVPVAVSGTAQPGVHYNVSWPGGVAGEITLDPGRLAAFVEFDPLSGADGVQVDLEMLPGDGYELGAQPTTTVAISEGSADPTLIEYDINEAMGVGQLVQACFPIPPTAPDSLPVLSIDGAEADVIPHTWSHDGLVESVQAVGPSVAMADSSGRGLATLAEQAGTPKPPTIQSPSGLQLTLVATVAGKAQPMRADLRGNVIRTLREGSYIREDIHFSTLRDAAAAGTVNENLTACHWLETNRNDWGGVEGYLLVSNNLFDPTGELYDVNDAVAGDGFFESMSLEVPEGWVVVAAWDDPSMDTANQIAIRAEASGMQQLTTGSKFLRYYCICPAAEVAKAMEVVQMKGYGTALSGEYSIYSRPWWSSQRDWLPEFTDNYTQPNTQGGEQLKGREAARERDRSTLEQMLVHSSTGSINSATRFLSTQQGYWRPYADPQARAPSGQLIHMRAGYHMTRECWLFHRVQMHHMVQREAKGATNVNTGLPVTAGELVENNTEFPGRMPWFVRRYDDRYRCWFPHFLDLLDVQADPELTYSPTDRVWNQHSGPLAQDDQVHNYRNRSHYGPYEGDHSKRAQHILQALAWGANLGVAKWLIEIEGTHVEMAIGQHFAELIPNSGIGYTYASNNLPMTRLALEEAGHLQWGGSRFNDGYAVYKVGDVCAVGQTNYACTQEHTAFSYTRPEQGSSWQDYWQVTADPFTTGPWRGNLTGGVAAWQRGWGHFFDIAASYGSLIGPGQRKSEMAAWAKEVARTCDWVLGPWGGAQRHDQGGGTPNHPANASYWGPHDPTNNTGAIAPTWTSEQSYMQTFLGDGLAGIEATFKPRLEVGEGLTGQAAPHMRQFVDLPRRVWEGTLAIGETTPPAYLIISDGQNALDDPPRQDGPRPWKFEVEPGQSITYGPDSDHRDTLAIVNAYKSTGDAVFLDYLKLQYQLPITATVEQLKAQVESFMNGDNKETDRTWGNQSCAVLGLLQHGLG